MITLDILENNACFNFHTSMHVWYVFFRSSPNRFINCILNRSVLIGFEEMLHFLNRNDGGETKKGVL